MKWTRGQRQSGILVEGAEHPNFLGGSRGMLPGKFLEIYIKICAIWRILWVFLGKFYDEIYSMTMKLERLSVQARRNCFE